MSSRPLQIFEAVQYRGWKADQSFRLFVVPGSLCGAHTHSSNDVFRGISSGFSSGGFPVNDLVSLVVVAAFWAVAWMIGAALASLLRTKETKRHEHLQELDPLGQEFLEENYSNFRLSSDEVERIVFSRSIHYYGANSIRPEQMQVRLTNGEQRTFTFRDAKTARAFGAQMARAGFTVENAA